MAGRHRGAVTSLAFSRDGRMLASGSKDGTAIFWDVAARAAVGRFASDGKSVGRVVFSPDGYTVAVATSEAITLCDATTFKPSTVLSTRKQGALEEVAFNRNGRLLARSGGGFALWDVAEARCLWGSMPGCDTFVQTLNHRAGVAFGPDGYLLAAGARADDAFIEFWDLRNKQWIARLEGHGGRRYAGAMVLAQGAGAGSFTMTYIRALAFNPSGRILVSGGDDGAVIFWDVATREPIPPPDDQDRSRHSGRTE